MLLELNQSKTSSLRRAISLLSRRDQKKIFGVMVIQTFMGFLDLFGVVLIGVLGALAVNGIESKQPGNRVTLFIKFFHLSNLSFQQQSAILGSAAVILMVSRTIISISFTRRTLHFLSRRGALISRDLIAELLRQPLTTIQSKTIQESIYSVTDGVKNITLGVIGTIVSLISDCSLLFVMSVGLFIVDPAIALTSSLIFGILGWVLYSLMHKRARKLGTLEAELNIESNKKITEVLTAYREAVVRNRRDYYANRIGEIRQELAYTLAEISFMPNVSKYVIETSVLIAALVIGSIQFLLQDASHAVATLSIFLAAGTRIAPAALRLQQGALTIKNAIGSASPTFKMIEGLGFRI
jgi:ATP-binding cassette subfamily C protein